MEVGIFDFDGTLTNNGHRRHLKGKEYVDARHEDTLVPSMWDLLATTPYELRPTYIVTGRSAELALDIEKTIRQMNADSVKRNAVTPSLFRGSVSFRPPGPDALPDLQEKVQRMLLLANMHAMGPIRMGHDAATILVAPSMVRVYDDDEEVLNSLVKHWYAGELLANNLALNHVRYAGAIRKATSVRLFHRTSENYIV